MSHTAVQQELFMAHALELGLKHDANPQIGLRVYAMAGDNHVLQITCERSSNFVQLTYNLGGIRFQGKQHTQLMKLSDFLSMTQEQMDRVRQLIAYYDARMIDLHQQIMDMPQLVRTKVQETVKG